jgi:heme A synthase
MVLSAHSGFRYLVLLMGILVIAYAAYGLATKRDYDKTMRILAAVFTGVVDVTALLGLATLFTGFGFYPQLGGHIGMMVLAAVVAHVVSAVMKRRPPEARTYMPHLVGTAIVLAIIVSGIMAIGRSVVG